MLNSKCILRISYLGCFQGSSSHLLFTKGSLKIISSQNLRGFWEVPNFAIFLEVPKFPAFSEVNMEVLGISGNFQFIKEGEKESHVKFLEDFGKIPIFQHFRKFSRKFKEVPVTSDLPREDEKYRQIVKFRGDFRNSPACQHFGKFREI